MEMNFEIFFLRGESGGQAAQSCDSCPEICLFCLDLITPSANYRYRREIEKVKSNQVELHTWPLVNNCRSYMYRSQVRSSSGSREDLPP
jgi:hypothetical protein